MEVWAHRGAYQGFREKENTLEAFRKVLDTRADGIELDVRLCGSGETIVFHDPTLWRMANAFVRVDTASLDELRDRAGFHIPTLQEVIEEFGGKIKLLLDLKPGDLGNSKLERAVADATHELALTDYKISSENLGCLSKFFMIDRKRCPELCLVVNSRFSLTNFASKYVYVNAVHVSEKLTGWDFLSRPKIRKWKERGLKVRVWTVNDSGQAQDLLMQGADGIITDNIGKIYGRGTNENRPKRRL